MKTIFLKLCCVLLCFIMLLVPLAACGEGEDNTPNQPNSQQPGDQTPDTDEKGDQDPDGPDQPEPDEPEISPDQAVLENLGKADYGSVDFVIVASSSYENRFVIDQFASDDSYNGNAVHDELFKRDSMIEEYFNINLVYDDVLDSVMATYVSGSISAGDDDYSLLLASLAKTAQPLFNNGLLRNIYDFEDIDLSQPWWNKKSVDNFELNGNIFMATGAITNRYVYAPYAMLFNTRLIDDLSLENPYDLVDRDEWTMETFAMMIEGTYQDDGNDEIGLEDFYGLAPASDSETAYYFACGGQMVAKQGDELLPLYEEEKNYDILRQIIDMYLTEDVLKFKSTYDSNVTFNDGRAIFHSTALCDITMLSEMADKYGIVPMPKYDLNQTDYISNANRSISTMAVFPISIRDTKMVGMITEALAGVSQYTSLDKQYDTVLLLRQALDEQSKRNLQLVVESVSYDWGYVFDIGKVKSVIADAILKGEAGVADQYATIQDAVLGNIEALMDKFQNYISAEE